MRCANACGTELEALPGDKGQARVCKLCQAKAAIMALQPRTIREAVASAHKCGSGCRCPGELEEGPP